MRAEPAQEGKFQWLARLGFVVRGFLYILIAVLVIATGRTEDLTGAIEYVGKGFGRWLFMVIAAGMCGYGLWRLGDAAFGMDSGRHSSKSWRRRIAAAGSGSIYLFLAFKAAKLLLGEQVGGGEAQQNAATAMQLSGGGTILLIASAVLVGAAFVQLHKAVTCSFLGKLDERARRGWSKWLGRIGYAARGVIFATVGYLLFRAGIDRSPAEAGGLEQALDALSNPMRYLVAVGLMLFGAYSLVEARYRSIHKPPVERVENEVREKLAG